MILDTMSKYEVMKTLRKEFDEEILPYYYKRILPRIRPLLQQRCQRENRTITLGWETVESKGLNTFKILKRGDKEQHLPLFVAEFRWKNKKCYGSFFLEGNVVVFQAHCLQRYSERVLNQDMSIDEVFYKHILKRPEAYHIVLPTPTHPYSIYFGIANALFLGDYDTEHLESNFSWCNTCISYNETRYSQLRITRSLHLLQEFINTTNKDFSNPKNEKSLRCYIKQIKEQDDKFEKLKEFITTKYLLWKLLFSFNFPFIKDANVKQEPEEHFNYLECILKEFDIVAKSLSPYSKEHGIAWKGEIDYIEHRN